MSQRFGSLNFISLGVSWRLGDLVVTVTAGAASAFGIL
jgi:hypothetical protein